MWLKSIPRAETARRVGIGEGSVSRIIDQIKSKEIPDIDLLRHVAVKIKNGGFELSDVASGIRISNFLNQMGTSEEEMEKLLKIMEIHCFKTEQDFHDFIVGVEALQDFVSNFGYSIRDIPDYLGEIYDEYSALKSEQMSRLLNSPREEG
jgi:hypothetical protein